MFRRKRVFKILSFVLGVCALVTVVTLAIVYFSFPSADDLTSGIAGVAPPQAVLTPAPPANPENPSPAPAARAPASSAPIRPTATDAMLSYLITRYVDTGATEIRVCDTLAGPAASPRTSLDWRAAFNDFASRQNRRDPVIESILVPVGYFVRLPNVAVVLQRMQDTLETGDRVFLDQPDFPRLLSLASSEVIRSRTILAQLSQRGYDLYTLARVVQMNPDLANDARTLNLCALITNAANRDMLGQASLPVSDEKQYVLNYLADIGVSPTQVRYDFNLLNEVSAVLTERQVSLSSPWLNRTMGTPFFVVALGEALPASPQ